MSIHTARQRRLPRPSGRQTAASMALTPYARWWRCGQAPKPRSGAPKAQGLTASPTAAAQSDVPSSTITFSTHPRPPIDTPITPRNYTSLTDAIKLVSISARQRVINCLLIGPIFACPGFTAFASASAKPRRWLSTSSMHTRRGIRATFCSPGDGFSEHVMVHDRLERRPRHPPGRDHPLIQRQNSVLWPEAGRLPRCPGGRTVHRPRVLEMHRTG